MLISIEMIARLKNLCRAIGLIILIVGGLITFLRFMGLEEALKRSSDNSVTRNGNNNGGKDHGSQGSKIVIEPDHPSANSRQTAYVNDFLNEFTQLSARRSAEAEEREAAEERTRTAERREEERRARKQGEPLPKDDTRSKIASRDGAASIANEKRRRAREQAAELEAGRMRGADLRKRLHAVPALFNTPTHLAYGRSTAITFVLETQGAGTSNVLNGGFEGPVVTADVLVGAEAQALLTGPPDLVEIKFRGAADLQRKAVTNIAPVQWTWDIRGVGVGTAVLQLELNAFIDGGKAAPPLQVKTFQQSIPINISLTDRIMRFMTELNPIWASGATVVTAIGGLLAYFGFKPGRRDKDPHPKGKDTPNNLRRPSIYGKNRSRQG